MPEGDALGFSAPVEHEPIATPPASSSVCATEYRLNSCGDCPNPHPIHTSSPWRLEFSGPERVGLALKPSWGAVLSTQRDAETGLAAAANQAGLRSNFGDLINAAGLHIEPRSGAAGGQDSPQMSAWTAQFFA